MLPTYFPLRWESTGDQWWYASPIDWAAANGHYDLVRELLRLDGNHLIKLSSLRRIHRLEVVWDDEEQFDDVAKNRSFVAQKLLHEGDTKRGKNSLIGSGYGGWLLYTAASAGDLPFVRELLHKDPLLVFGEGEYGVTDILYAAARSKNTEVFRLIYDFAMSPRFMASNGRELEEHIGEIPSAYKLEMKNRAVHALARGGNLSILKELIGDCSDDGVLGYRDIQGSTILHTAAGRGQVEVVKYLVSSYKIIDSVDKQGNTALHIAASRGHISVVDILIRESPSSVHSKNTAGETFLHTAITGFQTPTFRRLDRQIVLMKQLVCSKSFNIEEIINSTDNEGRTALHSAILGNIDSDLVELLMTVCSINVNKRDKDGLTPLDLLKQRPSSASSEVLKRQLISAGAILGNQDYTARKILASHLRKGSAGGSPGTTFGVSDSEIFLHSGSENTPCGTPVFATNDEPSQPNLNSNPNPNSNSNSNTESKIPNKKKHKGIKRFLRWPKTKKTVDEVLNLATKSPELPIPLRQKYSKPTPPSNNKRSLAARSNLASPTAKKKHASGLVNGVMQAMPHLNRRSRSDSFSRSSISSHSGIEIVGSSQMFDDGIVNKEEGVVNNRRSVNQYFCFGGSRLPVESSDSDRHQQHEIYDRYVLSTA